MLASSVDKPDIDIQNKSARPGVDRDSAVPGSERPRLSLYLLADSADTVAGVPVRHRPWRPVYARVVCISLPHSHT
jgi:hypothetical protein